MCGHDHTLLSVYVDENTVHVATVNLVHLGLHSCFRYGRLCYSDLLGRLVGLVGLMSMAISWYLGCHVGDRARYSLLLSTFLGALGVWHTSFLLLFGSALLL